MNLKLNLKLNLKFEIESEIEPENEAEAESKIEYNHIILRSIKSLSRAGSGTVSDKVKGNLPNV